MGFWDFFFANCSSWNLFFVEFDFEVIDYYGCQTC